MGHHTVCDILPDEWEDTIDNAIDCPDRDYISVTARQEDRLFLRLAHFSRQIFNAFSSQRVFGTRSLLCITLIALRSLCQGVQPAVSILLRWSNLLRNSLSH